MTTLSWFLVGALIYLFVGVILKLHTRIGTVVFADYGIRFVLFYAIPLGGLFVYMLGTWVYVMMLLIADLFFFNSSPDTAIDCSKLFPEPIFPDFLIK